MMHDGFLTLGDLNKNSITDIMKQELINFYKLPWQMDSGVQDIANEYFAAGGLQEG